MNFSLFLLVLTVVTGILWALDKFKWAPARRERAKEAVRVFDEANRQAIDRGDISVIGESQCLYKTVVAQPKWMEWTGALFPVIFAVFLVRSFIVEPFRIPSGSMLPTLHVGDFIAVNKFEYGLRFPVLNWEMTKGTDPKRGDIAVFKYPLDRNVDFIKRVVGLPGDEIRYIDKKLYINGELVETTPNGTFFDEESYTDFTQLETKTDSVVHQTIENNNLASMARPVKGHNGLHQCVYSQGDMVCQVPEGMYFMMGDNRDNSADSRFWGFVPREDFVGKAFFVWLNFSDFGRIGSVQ